jgi:hypothetical protein
MQVQLTEIEFDLDSDDIEQQPNLQESLQEEFVGLIYDLDMSDYDEINDQTVGDELVEEITCQSGWCIRSLNFRYVLS